MIKLVSSKRMAELEDGLAIKTAEVNTLRKLVEEQNSFITDLMNQLETKHNLSKKLTEEVENLKKIKEVHDKKQEELDNKLKSWFKEISK